MTFMRWNENYLTGIEIVDIQHQGLVELINRVAPILADNSLDMAKAGMLLDSLTDYVDVHFKTEEMLMSNQGIDPRHLAHHCKAHADFAGQVNELRRQFEQGDNNVIKGNELLRFLSNWLAFHILGEDQRMAKELKAIAQGHTQVEAYDYTEGNKAEILKGANDVLVSALVDLFTQLTEQNRLLLEKNRNIEAANKELDNARKTLEQDVTQRTLELRNSNEELVRARDKAEDASLVKSRFLGVVSHELLTPLNVILGFANLLEQDVVSDKQREHSKRIKAAAQHLTNLLQEVLYYSRLDAGEVNTVSERFHPMSVLTYVADWAKTQTRRTGVELSIDTEATLPFMYGDEKHLIRVLIILVSNALKFTDHGSVTLRVLVSEWAPPQAYLVFEVKDTGIGIPFEKQKDLFHLFEQLDASTTRRHNGLGLGLVVCARLIQLIGGELSFESSPGVGSTFRIGLWQEYEEPDSLNKLPIEDSATLENSHLLQDMRLLEQKLLDQNMEARQLFFSIERDLRQHFNEQQISILASQIHLYDFAATLITLRDIIKKNPLV